MKRLLLLIGLGLAAAGACYFVAPAAVPYALGAAAFGGGALVLKGLARVFETAHALASGITSIFRFKFMQKKATRWAKGAHALNDGYTKKVVQKSKSPEKLSRYLTEETALLFGIPPQSSEPAPQSQPDPVENPAAAKPETKGPKGP